MKFLCLLTLIIHGSWVIRVRRQRKLRIKLEPCAHWMFIIFNWITIQSIMLHSILFKYGSVHICENSNKLGRVTSKWRPVEQLPWYSLQYLTWRPEERQRNLRRLEEEKYAVWNSNHGWDSVLHQPYLGSFCPIRVSCCSWCLTHVAPPFHSIKRSKVWFPQTTTCLPFCSITHCNYLKQPQGGCFK